MNVVAGARSPYVLLTLAPFFWSVNWIVGRGFTADIPPLAMTFFRWLFAALMLALFAWPELKRNLGAVRAHRRALLALAAIGIAGHTALAYVGLNYTTATNGVILNSFIPVLIVAIAWIFLGERLTLAQIAGVGVSLAGVLTILSQGSLAALAAFRLNAGDLLVIVSMAMWAVYTLMLRWRPPALGPVAFLFVLAVLGDLCVLPFWLWEIAAGRTIVWSSATLGALVSVAFFSSVLAYVFWNRGVEALGPQVSGLFVHLMPVFGVVLAWLFLGERLEVYHLAGIALILSGIAITSRRRRAVAPAGID
jgi:drug/metabolite transporter (DMT)-like permease